ncbi:type II toxin-antitoxin system RelE/ParE family toxin [Asticcacaulis sp. DW145]|uniref:type II toxin-antitoxin system RelE/ParE family toxin n=1 Tax=Asticcacaulis sp. DW145 TaxID=3095608 RepID=UPI00308D7C73|nr:type II toxin-antitoxin system RelE/ParE family toxin [Asticcacaulis sp. DW145]
MTDSQPLKPIEFRGSSKKDLLAFPRPAIEDGGHQLFLVQKGEEPHDWKPMVNVGHGCFEIRISESGDAFRIIYVAKFADAVYVLHCFQKTTRQTAHRDIDLAKTRYQDLLRELKS